MAFDSGEGHCPSALSIIEPVLLAHKIYNFLDSDGRESGEDSFILSKGHGCLALYAILSMFGSIELKDLSRLGKDGSNLGGHPDRNKVEGVIASTGSLGHGVPIAVGLAYSKKYFSKVGKVLVLCGDGEANEGTIWESALLASEHKLDNLKIWIDFNKSGDRALKLDPLGSKFEAFGFQVVEVDGHDLVQVEEALRYTSDRPVAIISHATKGKGVRFMESSPEWHHKKLDLQFFKLAMADLR